MFLGKLLQRTAACISIGFMLLLVMSESANSQVDNFRFREVLRSAPNTSMAFAVPNNGNLSQLLEETEVRVKQVTPNWIYVQTTPAWIEEAIRLKKIPSFYFEFSLPKALNDSTLIKQYVKPVHEGSGGLQRSFTGKDVIVAYVDQGLDYTHPDFIDVNGQTRVLYYWDHTLPFDAIRTPQPYGYGQVWTAADIQSGNCGSSEESSAHGTSVTGAGSANGLANGKNKGMAPDSKIIVIETNFNLQNWTLTVADAIDFVFKKADELGLPAVVNLSVGSYLGSHDGDDPAAELIENLLDEHGGRVVVCAAGNSGAWGKYHVHDDVTADTSFVWIQPNPGSQLGPNTCYLDVWTDQAQAGWSYAFGANLTSGSYAERAETVYRNAPTATSSVIYDTLYNGTNRIATIEIYPEVFGNQVHLEIYFSNVDSTSYNFSFKTTGSGSYDGWSGSVAMALNNMETTNLPAAAVYPDIIHYNMPDTLQTIVSSWNCSEKVVTVGNIRNRQGHVDKNGNNYLPNPPNYTNVGQLTPASSKGPTRKGHIKPDVAACGDVSLSAGPFWLLSDPGFNSVIDIDGMHVRNGGTSMASPVVAGIAALYLEKCSNATYQDFMDALHATAYTDAYTGVVPNNAYGYGKAHALNLLLLSNFNVNTVCPTAFCPGDSAISTASISNYTIEWMNGDTTLNIALSLSDTVSFVAYDQASCKSYSDTVITVALSAPPAPVIYVNGSLLSTDPYPTLQWYENGIAIPGATTANYTVTMPSSSYFTVSRTSVDGCEVYSQPYNPSLGLEEINSELQVFPNPANEFVYIQSQKPIKQVILLELTGKIISTVQSNEIQVSSLAKGTYFLIIQTESQYFRWKFVKN
jgi:hypothetical protein